MFRGGCRGRERGGREARGSENDDEDEEEEEEEDEEDEKEEAMGAEERGGENSPRGREPSGSGFSVETSGMDKLRSDCPRG